LTAALAGGTSVAASRDHALVAFLLGTGARLSSALALDVADLDLEGGVATLRELKGGGSRANAPNIPTRGRIWIIVYQPKVPGAETKELGTWKCGVQLPND